MGRKPERWTMLGAVGTLVLAACGGTKNLGGDMPPSNGAAAGDGGNGAVGNMTSQGAAGTGGSDAAASGETGAGAEGGTGVMGVAGEDGESGSPGIVTDPRYDFYVVPGLAPEWVEPSLTEQSLEGVVSGDGSVVAGRTRWVQNRSDTTDFEWGEGQFVWSRESGTVALPQVDNTNLCLAQNGGAVFGARADKPGLVRWTRQGVEVFELEAKWTSVNMSDCTADGSSAILAASVTAGSGEHSSFIWREGEAGNALVELPRAGAFFSADGSMVFFQEIVTFGEIRLSRSPFPGQQPPVEIQQPDGHKDCYVRAALLGVRSDTIAPDGSVVVGACGEYAGVPMMFRWQEGDEAMQLVDDGPVIPLMMSPDGQHVLGLGDSGQPTPNDPEDDVLVWWTEEDRVQLPYGGAVHALTSDRSSAWVDVYTPSATLPRRWVRAEGLVPLPGLPNAESMNITGVSSDGSIAAGYAEMPPKPGYASSFFRMVVWDEQGIRDITSELTAAGFDLLGIPSQKLSDRLAPGRIWSGSSISITGGQDTSAGDQNWLAKIPAR